MSRITEGIVEDACLDFFVELGYGIVHGPDIGPGGSAEERPSWDQVILKDRLHDAVAIRQAEADRRGVQQLLYRSEESW